MVWTIKSVKVTKYHPFNEIHHIWTLLVVCEEQTDLRQFFTMNLSMQSNQEMIDYTILGEFWSNGEGTLGYHFKSSYCFFYTLNWSEKNYTPKSWWYVLIEKNQIF